MSCCDRPSHGLPDGFRLPRGVTRRDLLRYGLGGAGIVALGPWIDRRLPLATGAPQGNKILVVVEMSGGCDTTSAVVPKTLAPYYARRPTIQVPPGQELSLLGSSLYGFHPMLPKLKAMYDAGDVAVVNRVGYPTEDLSHFVSQDINAYGVRNGFGGLPIAPSGWIARYADLYAATPMGAVSVGVGHPTSFTGGASNPLQVSSLASFQFADDAGYSQNQVHRLDSIGTLLAQATGAGTPGTIRDSLSEALNLSGQVQSALSSFQSGVNYGARGLGRHLRDIAVLVQGGFETRVFYTAIGGFDTHSAQGSMSGNGLPALLGQIDDGLDALRQDLVAMGQWGSTVIALITEFGRRNYENGSQGLDHGAGYAEILVGGAVKGGFHGPDLQASDLNGEYLTYAVDFRDVWKEILSEHLGANPAPVFPEAQPVNQGADVI